MAARPKMPVPPGELTPQELSDRIKEWAESQGYQFQTKPHGGEFGKVIVRDPAGGHTFATVPNAHKGRRLRKDQVRYVVHELNNRWKG